jgi:hypothetical protein
MPKSEFFYRKLQAEHDVLGQLHTCPPCLRQASFTQDAERSMDCSVLEGIDLETGLRRETDNRKRRDLSPECHFIVPLGNREGMSIVSVTKSISATALHLPRTIEVEAR